MNHVIERLKETRAFEHEGNAYAIGRSTPFTVCQKYYDTIVARDLKRILEVGTLYGQSTLYLAEAAKATGGYVKTIDLRPERRVWMDNTTITNLHEAAERHITEAGLSSYVEFLVGDSNDVMPQLIEQGHEFDFILIDGSHEYPVALLDFINADCLLRPGGAIALDDIGATLTRRPECQGAPNRILPMIFASGAYSMTPLSSNVIFCTKRGAASGFNLTEG